MLDICLKSKFCRTLCIPIGCTAVKCHVPVASPRSWLPRRRLRMAASGFLAAPEVSRSFLENDKWIFYETIELQTSEIAFAHCWKGFFPNPYSIMVAPRQIEHHLSVNFNRQRYPAKAMPSSPTVRSEAQASGLPSELNHNDKWERSSSEIIWYSCIYNHQ